MPVDISVNDNELLYEDMTEEYREYTYPVPSGKMEDFCFPAQYTLSPPQKFAAEFLDPDDDRHNALLLFHKIGAGKTCAAIQVALRYVDRGNKVIVVLPASLRGNFIAELMTQCADNRYLSKKERNIISKLDSGSDKFTSIIDRAVKKIEKDFKIVSYEGFVKLIDETNPKSMKNSLIIIDEVHNIISDTGLRYKTIHEFAQKTPLTMKLLVMTGTPIYDKPSELALLINLLRRGGIEQIPTDRQFNNRYIKAVKIRNNIVYELQNQEELMDYMKGYISYFRGAPPYSYPKMSITYLPCEMSKLQINAYDKVEKSTDVEELSKSFHIGLRKISNIVYPNGLSNQAGYKRLTKADFKGETFKKYSPKIVKCFNLVNKSNNQEFIYSGFKGYSGGKAVGAYFEKHGYKNLLTHGSGPKRYAYWSGEQTPKEKDLIRNLMNNNNNLHGELLKVVIGSPAIKEGVNFSLLKGVHVLEPYWNWSRIHQIFGRGYRFCAQKNESPEDRWIRCYIYYSTRDNNNSIQFNKNGLPIKNIKYKNLTIEEGILIHSFDKENIADKFIDLIKRVAVDCTLNKNANVYPGEEDYDCYY